MVYTSSNFRQISKNMSNIINNIKNSSKEMFSKMKLPNVQKKKPIPSEQQTEAEKKKKEIDDAQRVLKEALQRKKKEHQSLTIPSTNLSTSANEKSPEMTESERIKKNLKEFTKRRIENMEKKKEKRNFLYRKKTGSTNDEKPKRYDLLGDYRKRKEMSEAEMLREFRQKNKIPQVPDQQRSGQVTNVESTTNLPKQEKTDQQRSEQVTNVESTTNLPKQEKTDQQRSEQVTNVESTTNLPKQGEAQQHTTFAQKRKAFKNKYFPNMKRKKQVVSHQYPNTQPVKQLSSTIKKSFSDSTNDQKSKSNDLFGDYQNRKKMSADEMLKQFKKRNKSRSGQKQ